jgi:hypothetical protein
VKGDGTLPARLLNSRGKGADGGGGNPSASCLSAERPEGRPQFVSENRRLLPSGEVSTLVGSVVINELGVGPLGPAPRGLILLAGKDGHRHRNGDTLGVEEATLIFPIEARRRDTRIRQPIERDVVEDLIPRQLARGARRPVQSRGDRCRRLAISIIVVEKPSGEADG